MTVEALTDREAKQPNTSLQKEEMLRHKSFPLSDGDQYYARPPAGSAHTRGAEQAVERELFSQSVKNAPGPHKLSSGAIRLLWNWDTERIVRLTRAAIPMVRHLASVSNGSGLPGCGPGLEPDRTVQSGLLPGNQGYPPGLGTG